MAIRRYLTLFFLAFTSLPFQLVGAQIQGKVTDPKGKPLPYTNVYIEGTTKGTTTNQEGEYQLTVRPGQYAVVFKYMGYKQKTKRVTVGQKTITLNVTLKPLSYNMETVTVSGQDPAYRIIKNVIEKKSQFRKAVKQYQCKVYAKGNIKTDSFRESFLVDSSDLPKGLLYLSESVSRLYYQYPAQYKEIMISSKVSGNKQGISFNFAFNNPYTFYQNYIDFSEGTQRPLVSPVADNALFFYEYEWQGTFEEDNQKIHKIKVIPKRSTDPVFQGTITIVDKEWWIHSVNFKITQKNGLNQFDSLRMKQSYVPINDSVWRLYNQNFRFGLNIFGIGLKGSFLSHFSNYDLSPEIDSDFFDNELIKITKESSDRDSAYWAKIRPVKLEEEEIEDYELKDSLEAIRNSPGYLDSVDRVQNKPLNRRNFTLRIQLPAENEKSVVFNFGPNSFFPELQYGGRTSSPNKRGVRKIV